MKNVAKYSSITMQEATEFSDINFQFQYKELQIDLSIKL